MFESLEEQITDQMEAVFVGAKRASKMMAEDDEFTDIMANYAYKQYRSFCNAGFGSQEAFELTKVVVGKK